MALTRSLITALFAGLFGLCGLPCVASEQVVVPPTSKVSAKSWQQLSPAQQLALKPMQADWAALDDNRKKKWLAVAQRYQTLSPADQARMHSRMAEWAKLTPEQRSAARDNYSAVLSSPSSSGDSAGKSHLNEQWVKYQALPAEKKASLAEQANKGTELAKTKPLPTP